MQEIHPTFLNGAIPSKHCTQKNNTVSSKLEAAKLKQQRKGDSTSNELANTNFTVCRSLGVQCEVSTSTTMPVIVHDKDSPDNKVKTYALPDDGSDSTFITNDLLSTIDAKGVDG